MLHTKYCNHWPCSFEEVRNVKLLTDGARRPTHEDVRRPIAIGRLSDSGDLKIQKVMHSYCRIIRPKQH